MGIDRIAGQMWSKDGTTFSRRGAASTLTKRLDWQPRLEMNDLRRHCVDRNAVQAVAVTTTVSIATSRGRIGLRQRIRG